MLHAYISYWECFLKNKFNLHISPAQVACDNSKCHLCAPLKHLETWKHCLGIGDMAENKTDKNQIPYGASNLGGTINK